MAAITASRASERIESRRWPPDFISPGPSLSRGPRSSRRAIRARVDSRTSSARARVIAPSSAFGQRPNRASAAISPSRASPRNSSRSLCGAPALRWVSARSSRLVSAKRWPNGSVDVAGTREHLGCLELADHVEVAHQRPAHFVLHVHFPAVVHPAQLHVLLLHVLGVV